jgi:hypothetical protein
VIQKKLLMIARAFREAQIDVQELPEVIGKITITYANEVQKQSDRDGDTLVFMTIDQLLQQWQAIRSADPIVECRDCLDERSEHVPADYYVVVTNYEPAAPGTTKTACCDPHAAKRRDRTLKIPDTSVHLERIRR